jgi:hypothetical protein
VPLAYNAPPPPPEPGSFAPLAARLAWLAPAVAILFMLVSAGIGDEPVARIIGGVGILIILAGVAFGIIALSGMRRAGRDGVLGPAVVGLTVNLLLILAIGTVTVLYVRVQRATSQARLAATSAAITALANSPTATAPPSWTNGMADSVLPPAATDATTPAIDAPTTPSSAAPPPPSSPTAAADSTDRQPGWLGATDRMGLRIIVLQWHDEAPGRQKMKELYEADSTIVTVIINNAAGNSHVTIDPASLEFHFNDYTTLKALPPAQILETARSDREYYLKRYGGEWNVPPRKMRNDGLAFFPPGADLTNARAVTMVLNDQRIVVPGRYCTADEKAQILEQLQAGR